MATKAVECPQPKNRTLAVSPDFADMIIDLARSKGLTVREYCDEHAVPRFAPDHNSYLAARMQKNAKRRA